MLGTNVTQKVLATPPPCFVAKYLRVAGFLKHPTIQASGFYFGWPCPGSKGALKFFAFCRCHDNPYAFDDQWSHL